MGEKTAARAIMEKAGVPVVPGALLPEPDADGHVSRRRGAAAACAEVGYPLMVKAAFGGGGKGMRLVEDPDEVVARLRGGRPRGPGGLRQRHGLPGEIHRDGPGTWSSRSSATATATTSTCSSASAPSSAATRRSSRKRPRRP